MKIQPKCSEPGCIDSAGFHPLIVRILTPPFAEHVASREAYCLRHAKKISPRRLSLKEFRALAARQSR